METERLHIQEILSTSLEWKILSLANLVKPSDFCLPSLFVSLRSWVHLLAWNCNPFPAKFLEFSGYLVEIILLCTHHCCYLVTQSCLALCYLLDYSPPGSSVHGIFQARILEWVATSFSSAFRQYYLPNSKILCLCAYFYNMSWNFIHNQLSFLWHTGREYSTSRIYFLWFPSFI